MTAYQFQECIKQLIDLGEISGRECAYISSVMPFIPYQDIYKKIWKVAFDDTEFLTVPETFDSSYYEKIYPSWFMMQSCCGGTGNIRWNTSDKQWKCTDCGSVKSNDPNYYWTPKTRPDAPAYPTWNTIKKCTCGSSSVGSNKHSDWCDNYEKNS